MLCVAWLPQPPEVLVFVAGLSEWLDPRLLSCLLQCDRSSCLKRPLSVHEALLSADCGQAHTKVVLGS